MNVAQMVGVVVIGVILAAWNGCNGCSAKKAVNTATTADAKADTAVATTEKAEKELADWREKKLSPWSTDVNQRLDGHDKKIETLERRPATVVTVTPATVTPAPAKWNLDDLIKDFQNADRATAELAAKRLAAEGKGSEALVKLFSETSSEVTKNRIVWSLRYWAGEPARQYLLNVLTDPAPHRSGIVSAVAEIVKRIDALNTPAKAKTGPQGPAGEDGKKGEDGVDGKDGKDGMDGKDGKKGSKGDKGDSASAEKPVLHVPLMTPYCPPRGPWYSRR